MKTYICILSVLLAFLSCEKEELKTRAGQVEAPADSISIQDSIKINVNPWPEVVGDEIEWGKS